MSTADVVRACERLVFDSAAHNDARDWDALAALYTVDARLTRPSGQTIEGRDAIRESYATGAPERRTRHLCTNVRVDVDGEKRARAVTSVVVVSWAEETGTTALPTAGGAIVGTFVDTFALTGEGWRIAARAARLDVALP